MDLKGLPTHLRTNTFFIAGVRHYLGCDGDNCEKSLTVTRGDEVILKREPGNQYDENAREQ